jgi:hypothetical protein
LKLPLLETPVEALFFAFGLMPGRKTYGVALDWLALLSIDFAGVAAFASANGDFVLDEDFTNAFLRESSGVSPSMSGVSSEDGRTRVGCLRGDVGEMGEAVCWIGASSYSVAAARGFGLYGSLSYNDVGRGGGAE